ncbi:MAG: response regulator, partial [Burkholderiaceae bacterium]|nr:response regulator [Burkholderiaceae bacterium]
MSTLNGTIYLIDDDDAIRRSLSRMLADVGYDVFDYNSATSFLSNSRVVSPAVILLDMQMPDLSGLELLDCLEKNGSTTPIIFLSGQSHPQQIVKGLKKGALDFLFKPFNLEEYGTSSNNIDFMERSYVNQISPAKKGGFMAHGVLENGITFAGSVYQQNTFGET